MSGVTGRATGLAVWGRLGRRGGVGYDDSVKANKMTWLAIAILAFAVAGLQLVKRSQQASAGTAGAGISPGAACSQDGAADSTSCASNPAARVSAPSSSSGGQGSP